MPPLVSICCATYNHKLYIAKAIEGFLFQITKFNFEIVIHDDASTDGTSNIIKEYAAKHKNIVAIMQPTNLMSKGINPTADHIFSKAKGKYIALCDGDDYWTDPYKLQKQVDLLEANPEYVACFHDVKILETNGDIVNDYITTVPNNYETILNLAEYGNYIHTPSILFRNILNVFPKEFHDSPVGDYFLYMLLAEHGKYFYFNEPMAVYRNGVGIWSGRSELFRYKNTIKTFALLALYFRVKHEGILTIYTYRISQIYSNIYTDITINELRELVKNDEIVFLILEYHKNILSNSNLEGKSFENIPVSQSYLDLSVYRTSILLNELKKRFVLKLTILLKKYFYKKR